jgi:hypothetical protein
MPAPPRSDAFIAFLHQTLGAAAKASIEGAIHFACMDWRHFEELVVASRSVYGAMLNLIAWVKTNAGQGSFYRSQHELIGVFRVGATPHLNTIELGRHGRNRSNVWHYAGANAFRAGRLSDLRAHPTVKPVAMIAEAMKDCTRRNEIVLTLSAVRGRQFWRQSVSDVGATDWRSTPDMSMWRSDGGRRSPAGTPCMSHLASPSKKSNFNAARRRRLPAPVPSISAAGGSRHDPQTALSILAG